MCTKLIILQVLVLVLSHFAISNIILFCSKFAYFSITFDISTLVQKKEWQANITMIYINFLNKIQPI